MTDQQQPERPGDPSGEHTRWREVTVRRRPSLTGFLATGAVLGFLAGALLSILGEQSPMRSALQELILVGATGALLGLLVGAAVYLVMDRRSTGPRSRP